LLYSEHATVYRPLVRFFTRLRPTRAETFGGPDEKRTGRLSRRDRDPVPTTPTPESAHSPAVIVALTSSRSLSLAADDWRDLAPCQAPTPHLFCRTGTTGPAIEQIENAKAVCDTCAAKDPCLEFARMTSQDSGVWGGTYEEERRKLRRA